MDITQIVVPIVSAVISIGAVSAFISKYITKTIKYVKLAARAISTLEDVAESLQDGVLTAEETLKLTKDVADFKAALNS